LCSGARPLRLPPPPPSPLHLDAHDKPLCTLLLLRLPLPFSCLPNHRVWCTHCALTRPHFVPSARASPREPPGSPPPPLRPTVPSTCLVTPPLPPVKSTHLPLPVLRPRCRRNWSGKVLNALAPIIHELAGGSADLAPSNKTELKCSGDYQKVTALPLHAPPFHPPTPHTTRHPPTRHPPTPHTARHPPGFLGAGGGLHQLTCCPACCVYPWCCCCCRCRKPPRTVTSGSVCVSMAWPPCATVWLPMVASSPTAPPSSTSSRECLCIRSVFVSFLPLHPRPPVPAPPPPSPRRYNCVKAPCTRDVEASRKAGQAQAYLLFCISAVCCVVFFALGVPHPV
jgi:hypothetical protein